MHVTRGVLAEWQLVRIRLLRTRLGLWLLLLGAGLVWLAVSAPHPDLVRLAVRAGALASILTVAFGAGSDTDRAAIAMTLTHPTSPASLACGRWLAAVSAGALVVFATTAASLWRGGAAVPVLGAIAAGLGTAAAVAGCTLPLVWLWGNAAAGVLFLYIGLAGALPPEQVVAQSHAGLLRLTAATLLEVAPSVWRYQALAAGGPTAWLHAIGWTVGGIVGATWTARWRR